MQVAIETLQDGLRLMVQITEKTSLVRGNINWMLNPPGCDAEGTCWEAVEALPNCFRCLKSGPFAFDGLIRFLEEAPRHLAMLEAFSWARVGKKITLEALEPWTLEIIFDGERLPSVKALQERVGKIAAKWYALGNFELSQPKLLISDPCYERGAQCTGVIEAKTGGWHAESLIGPTDWLVCVKALRIRHESVDDAIFEAPFEETGLDIGVGSGVCGFFDEAKYIEDANSDASYDKICDQTISGLLRGAIIERRSGVVTVSGFGDGSYSALVRKNSSGAVVAAQVFFIREDKRGSDAPSSERAIAEMDEKSRCLPE